MNECLWILMHFCDHLLYSMMSEVRCNLDVSKKVLIYISLDMFVFVI